MCKNIMSSHLKISVVIITFNRYDYLRLAIESVLDQKRLPDEIVVLDDGSNDSTVDYLMELQKTLPNSDLDNNVFDVKYVSYIKSD